MQAAATGAPLNFDVMALAPYGFKTKNGEVKGIFVDILKAISYEANLDTRHNLYSIPRLIQKMRNRQCACSIFLRLPRLDHLFRFVAPIPWEVNIVVVGERHLNLRTLQDLKPLRVAVPRGIRFNNPLDATDAFIRFPTNGYLQSTRMLKRGRVDAMAGTEPSLTYLIHQEGLTRQLAKLVVDTRPMALYCINGLEIYASLEGAVKSLAAEGIFAGIIQKYATPGDNAGKTDAGKAGLQ